MSAISLKSITGITSITTPAGVDNQLTLHTNDTTERFKIDEAGNVRVANTFDCVGVSTFRNNLFAQADLRISGEIVHISDDNTRIQFPSNDTIAFKTSGSERLRIDSSGRVMIGTTTAPNNVNTDDFTLATGGATGFTIRSGTSHDGQIAFSDGTSGADEYRGQVLYNHGSNYMRFVTNAVERLRIDSGGRSLFRTNGSQTTPVNDDNVPVQIAEATANMCYFGANKGSSYGSLFGHHTAFGGTVIRNTASDDIVFYTNNTQEKLRIDSSGAVMIGTTAAPSGANTKLRVHFPQNSSSGEAIEISHDTNGADKVGAAFGLAIQNGGASTNAADLIIRTASNGSTSERLRILSDGTIQYRTGGGKGFEFNSSGSSASVAANMYAPASYTLAFGTNGNERVRIDSTGRVMIGTTTEGQATADDLTIATSGTTGITIRSGTSNDGNIYFSDGTSGSDEFRGYVQYGHSSNDMVFGTNAKERLRIRGDGEIRINHTQTSTPLNNTFISIWDANSDSSAIDASGVSKNYAMISLHNYGTGVPGDTTGIAFGAGTGFSYTKGSIAFQRTASYGTGDLVFLTNNDQDTTMVNDTDERMRITRDGDYLFLGGTLRIKNSANNAQRGAIYGDSSSFHVNAGGNLKLYSGGGERLTFDNNGNLFHNSAGSGYSYFKGSSEYVFGSEYSSPTSGGGEADFQIHTGKSRAQFSLNSYFNNAGGSMMQFISSRSGTRGVLGTKVQSNDYLAEIRFFGDNGTNGSTLAQGANIWCRAKSTPADGNTSIAAELNFALGSGNNSGVYDTVKMQSDGKLRYGMQQHSTPQAVQARGFSIYPNNGGTNITRFTFTGLVSGCYIAQIGYYNSAGSGYGGLCVFVSGYQTHVNTYNIHTIQSWNGANTVQSSIAKYNQSWVVELTNNHASYTAGGEVGIIGEANCTVTVTYH